MVPFQTFTVSGHDKAQPGAGQEINTWPGLDS